MTTAKRNTDERVSDPASAAALAKAVADGVSTAFGRADEQGARCAFGMSGVCCRICYMGPCRITKKTTRGVCGADADTIVARNYLREVAAGTAAHSDHARHLVLLLKSVAEGRGGDYGVKDSAALRRAARAYRLDHGMTDERRLAGALADLLLEEFTSQDRPLRTLALAPEPRVQLWRRTGAEPAGIDRMVVEALHRTHMGVDHEYRSVLLHAFRTSLADGWGGSRIASMVSDILFGTPSPVRSDANLGVLKADMVNVVVHGHEPELSEMLAVASRDPEVLTHARAAGASGVNLAGMCCTANEILMRHGIPVAGSFLQQELAIVTGAVEMMLIDVQCCMPSLPEVARAYHTEIVSTADIARTAGATHHVFDRANALESAKALLRRAADNFRRRDPARVAIPADSQPLVAGFSVEAIRYMLGGRFRASYRPLNDAVMQGRIRGVAGIVGCNNAHAALDQYTNELTRTLIAANILVVKTGCAAIASAKQGLLTPETALDAAGPGLREVCEAIGMPPILHMGSCVDNSRILEAVTEVVREKGLGDDLAQVPAVGVAPEWMSEKAVAIGCYFVASGIDVVLGHRFRVSGSAAVDQFLHGGVAELFGASFHVADTAVAAAELVKRLIEARREKLGINRAAERKLYDMKDRRALGV